jgi:hypothetical protein
MGEFHLYDFMLVSENLREKQRKRKRDGERERKREKEGERERKREKEKER